MSHFKWKCPKIFWRVAQPLCPLHRPLHRWRGEHPLLTPHPPWHLRRLDRTPLRNVWLRAWGGRPVKTSGCASTSLPWTVSQIVKILHSPYKCSLNWVLSYSESIAKCAQMLGYFGFGLWIFSSPGHLECGCANALGSVTGDLCSLNAGAYYNTWCANASDMGVNALKISRRGPPFRCPLPVSRHCNSYCRDQTLSWTPASQILRCPDPCDPCGVDDYGSRVWRGDVHAIPSIQWWSVINS